MYKKNKAGIYVYPAGIYDINNISWIENSINHNIIYNSNFNKYRMINGILFGIDITKIINVQKK